MTSPAGSLEILALYAAGVAAAAGAARFLARPFPRRTLALLAALPLLFVSPGLVRRRTLVPADHAWLTRPDPRAVATTVWTDDVARQFAPWTRASALAWRGGELPLRNRWNGCGTALAANGSSAAFFPPTLAALLLPTADAFTFWAALRLFLALGGVWLWLTALRVSPPAALFGAVAFGFSLSMTAWIAFPQTAVLSLWPWMLWAVERRRDPAVAVRAFAVLAAVFAALPLAGHLESVASICAFTAVWLGVRFALGERAGSGAVVRGLAGAAALALGLTAFALLPQALAIRDSNRLAIASKPFWADALSARPHGPLWRKGYLAIALPRISGDGITVPMAPDAAGAYPEIALGHFGVVALALAALVLRPGSRRRPAGLALAAPLVLGAAAATGTWPVAELAALVPALSRMFPLRYLTWVAFAGAALAACELDRLFEDLRSRRGAAVWPLAAWAGVAGLAAAISFRGAPAGLLAPERHAPLLAAAAAAAACAVFAATVLPRGGLRAAAVPLLTVVAGAELARQGTRLCRWSDPALLYPETPLVRFLRHAPGPFRIAGSGAALYPNVGVFAGVEDVRTHDPVERRDYVEFLDAVCGYPPREYFKRLADPGCGALAFLNVRYLAAPPESAPPAPRWTPVYTGPDGSLFADATARPRVFAPETVRVVRRPAAGILREPATVAYGVPYRELLRGLDLRREAVALDDGKNAFAPSVGPAEVSGYREGVNGATFRARTDPKGRGALLVTSLVDDGGWRARRETGEPVPSGRANGPFLALQAPPGDHAIRLSYAPPGFRAGVSVSAATAAAAAVVLVARRRRGSRPRLEAAA